MNIEIDLSEKFYLDSLLKTQEEMAFSALDLTCSRERRDNRTELCGIDDCVDSCPMVSGIVKSAKIIRSIRIKLGTVKEGDPYGFY